MPVVRCRTRDHIDILAVKNMPEIRISLYFVRKIFEVKFPLKRWLKTLFSGIIFLIAIDLLKKVIVFNLYLEIIITLLISGVIYLIMLFFLGLLKKRDLKFVFDTFLKGRINFSFLE